MDFNYLKGKRMADITMCYALDCPSRATCERHEDSGTKPNPDRQSWQNYEAQRDDELWCQFYVEKAR